MGGGSYRMRANPAVRPIRNTKTNSKSEESADAALSPARIRIDPFSGCNCYYLLEKACYNNTADEVIVTKTLEAIKDMGFTVVRIWAFNEDTSKFTLHTKGELVEDKMKRLDWLLREMKSRGLKAMMTLGNRLKDYGGMEAYLRWAHQDDPQNNEAVVDYDLKNHRDLYWVPWNLQTDRFYDSLTAKRYYKDFVTNIVKRYSKISDSDISRELSDVVHSWDICNEPRSSSDASADKMVKWLKDVAKQISPMTLIRL